MVAAAELRRDACLWIDGGRRAFCPCVSLPAQACAFRFPQWYTLANDTCTQARGNLPLAGVQLVTLPTVRKLGVIYP